MKEKKEGQRKNINGGSGPCLAIPPLLVWVHAPWFFCLTRSDSTDYFSFSLVACEGE